MLHSLPLLGLLTFATTAAIFDACRRSIPNRLTGCGLLAGLALTTACSAQPWLALGLGLVAVALGAAVAAPLWRLGVVGGGDVKLLAACGAFVTPLGMLGLLGYALLAFGLCALLLFAIEGRLGESLVASTRFILGYPAEASPRTGTVLHFASAVPLGAVMSAIG